MSGLSSNAPPAGSSHNSNINSNASSGGKHKQRNIVISTQKNGGHSRVFPTTQTSSSSSGAAAILAKPKNFFQIKNIGRNLRSALQSTFMPSGFPQKTPSGYLKYSVWSWIQDISTQLRSVLATQRILEGVGVGREGATALSALMNYLARDGCGMAATLIFTSLASSRFRSDVKRWRLFADLMVDIGITLEVAALSTPRFFLPMICLGSACKSVCGVAAGACGGSINLFWAQGSDISDIQAKFGAQHTVTGALGLVFAALFARSVATWRIRNLWILFSALTVVHIGANCRCMRLIAFDSLNQVRMNIILTEFFSWWEQQTQATNVSSTTAAGPGLSPPNKVTNVEPLFFSPEWLRPKIHALKGSSVKVHFGEDFNSFSEKTKSTSGAEITETLLHAPGGSALIETVIGGEGYLISAGIEEKGLATSKNNDLCVCVVFRSNATPLDEAKAYLHSLRLGRRLKTLDVSSNTDTATIVAIEQEVQDEMQIAWNVFQTSCEIAGWDLTKTELRTMGFEIALDTRSEKLYTGNRATASL